MKKLLLRLLLLALPFLAYVVAFEIRYDGKCNTLYEAKRRLLEARMASVETLVLGSSHTYNGILPENLGSNAFNLAAPAQSLYYDLELARRYVPLLPRLRTVIVPLSYFSLFYQLDESDEMQRCFFFRRFHGLPHRRWTMELDPRNFSLYFLYGRNPRGILNRDARQDYDEAGGLLEDARPVSAEVLERSAASAIQHHHSRMKPAHLAANRTALVALAGFLREHGIRLVLVTTPVSPGYRSRMQPDVQAEMQVEVRGFCEREGVEYLDFLDDARFTSDDFLDGDHLNRRGAARLSTYLAQSLAEKGQRKPVPPAVRPGRL